MRFFVLSVLMSAFGYASNLYMMTKILADERKLIFPLLSLIAIVAGLISEITIQSENKNRFKVSINYSVATPLMWVVIPSLVMYLIWSGGLTSAQIAVTSVIALQLILVNFQLAKCIRACNYNKYAIVFIISSIVQILLCAGFGNIGISQLLVIISCVNLLQMFLLKSAFGRSYESFDFFDIKIYAKTAITLLPLTVVYFDRVVTEGMPVDEYTVNAYMITIGSGVAVALTKVLGYKIQFEKSVKISELIYLALFLACMFLAQLVISNYGDLICSIYNKFCENPIYRAFLASNIFLLYVLLFSIYGIAQRYLFSLGDQKSIYLAATTIALICIFAFFCIRYKINAASLSLVTLLLSVMLLLASIKLSYKRVKKKNLQAL